MASLCNVAKYDCLALGAAPVGSTFKIAFYSAAASLSATTTGYSATNEVTQAGATPALNAGGYTLANRNLSASDGSAATAFLDFDNVVFTPVSDFTFQKILVYDSTRSRAIMFHDYGATQTASAGVAFTLTIPGSGSGIVTLA